MEGTPEFNIVFYTSRSQTLKSGSDPSEAKHRAACGLDLCTKYDPPTGGGDPFSWEGSRDTPLVACTALETMVSLVSSVLLATAYVVPEGPFEQLPRSTVLGKRHRVTVLARHGLEHPATADGILHV